MQLINDTNYRSFPAVSKSDLTWLEEYWLPQHIIIDLRKAYANGTLIDAMITEPEKVDYFKLSVQGEDYQYNADEFAAAKEMKKAFYKDPFCAAFVKQCKFQHISYQPNFKVNYEGFEFTVPAKCKWDLFRPDIDLSGDIKSTACTTQKQVEEVVRHFAYDRSRAWYMDLENRSNDILIFISKVNFKVFKVPVKRDSSIYRDGKTKYQEIAFKWWYLFSDLTKSS
ncbi:MAG: PD-(D/E)XK nuclease-like domain-containing protein [Chitinophagaceae bacterium]|nr:PD-(D/E)XK nuclease-like domain-containing protein [Chitinophagaceae bacterium]